MIPTTLPPTVLPRAACLTDALLAPPEAPPTARDLEALRHRLQAALVDASPTGCPNLRVDAYLLRSLAREDRLPDHLERFAWTPVNARRSIGLAAVRRCLEGRARYPAEAVTATVASMIGEARAGVVGRGSPARWLSEIAEGARAAVEAEAVSWATRLLVAVEWHRLARPPIVGAPDRWWDCPGARIALRGRCDARVETPGGRQTLLTMMSGHPGQASRVELALGALVDVVGRPSAPPPARVVGWWPECGRALVLAMDLGLLEETARTVVTAVRRHSPGTEAAATRRAA
ncbi:MAG: hypothetical protein ACLP62_06410 [Acidimicrobiales bacterium]